MKNIKLLAVLVILIAGAYFIEEKWKFDNELQKSVDESAIKLIPEEITQLKIAGVTLEKKDGHFYYNGLADEVEQNQLFEFQSLFKEIKLLEQSKEKFTAVYQFELNQTVFSLGEVNQLTGHFLIKYGTQEYVASSTVHFEGMYRSDLDKRVKSYQHLMLKLEAAPVVLLGSLFPGQIKELKRKIGDHAVTINFVQNQTLPKPLEFLGYDQNQFAKIAKLFSQQKKLSVTTKLDDKELMGQLDMTTEHKQLLYKLFRSNDAYYLGLADRYYRITDQLAELLFTPVSTYWGKVDQNFGKELSQNMSFKLRDQAKQLAFKVLKDGRIEGQNGEVIENQGMSELFCYLLHCKEEYDYLTINEVAVDTKKYYQLSVGQQRLFFRIEKSVLKVYHPEKKVEFTYFWPLVKEGDTFKQLF